MQWNLLSQWFTKFFINEKYFRIISWASRDFWEDNLFFNIENIDIDNYKKNKHSDIRYIYEKIFYGGYPELIENKIDREIYFSSYAKTYIERDIRSLINVKDEIKFNSFIVELAARTGQELNLLSIADDIGISIPMIKEWMSILLNTGIIYILYPYYENEIKRIVKWPKIYFLDTGLATYLVRCQNVDVLMNSVYSVAYLKLMEYQKY